MVTSSIIHIDLQIFTCIVLRMLEYYQTAQACQ
jgi:hypothetical protein